jgi:hypothetical protein
LELVVEGFLQNVKLLDRINDQKVHQIEILEMMM